jgi:hypothetical protein
MNRATIHDATSDPRIDRALESIGAATPAAGLEGRILNRLAAERIAVASKPARIAWLNKVMGRSPRFSRHALGAASALALCFAIVAGSVNHSRRTSHGVLPPPVPLAGQGIGAASAVHPAAPASTPAPAGEPGRASRSAERSPDQGRARIAPHSRKAPGAVPAPPAGKPSGDSQY